MVRADQHANRSNTRAEVRFDVEASPSLGPRQRARCSNASARSCGWRRTMNVHSPATRALALERLAGRLHAALRIETPRRPTAPTQAARRRRVEAKRRLGEKKRQRRPPTRMTIDASPRGVDDDEHHEERHRHPADLMHGRLLSGPLERGAWVATSPVGRGCRSAEPREQRGRSERKPPASASPADRDGGDGPRGSRLRSDRLTAAATTPATTAVSADWRCRVRHVRVSAQTSSR